MEILLSKEADYISNLIGFAEGFLTYHQQCEQILKEMLKQLKEKYSYFILIIFLIMHVF